MPIMKVLSKALCMAPVALAIPLLPATSARASGVAAPAPMVSTSSIRVALSASGPQPHLAWISGPAGPSLRNRTPEPLPPNVEIKGAMVSLTWQHRPALDTSDPHHAVFVYESENPHLRLRWEWQARADFGPIEHPILIQNLHSPEGWLPIVGSFRGDWGVAATSELRHF